MQSNALPKEITSLYTVLAKLVEIAMMKETIGFVSSFGRKDSCRESKETATHSVTPTLKWVLVSCWDKYNLCGSFQLGESLR